MPGRRPSLALALFASTACGDDGGGTSAATNITGVSASSTGGEPTPTTSAPEQPTTSSASAPASTTDAPGTGSTTTASPTTGTVTSDATSTTTTETTAGADDTTTTTASATDTSTGGPVCGDGVVDPGETCDDGQGLDCTTYHDGGAGTCVPPGECSPGYILSGDACVAELATDHVHIMVDNQCNMNVMPPEFTVPAGQKLRLDYHNHSQDYAVDVWMHYNGGFTDLAPSATWSEKYEHCFGPAPSEGWAEISTACSDFVLPIHCL